MKKIVLTPNPYRDRNFKYVTLADKLLREAGLETRICLAFDVDRSFELPDNVVLTELNHELRDADLLVCFGGDGTILHASKAATKAGIPVLGVNIGTMGFMAELGILALTGTIIRNSMVLVDQIQQHLDAGMEPAKAITESAIVRFRPIMLAAFTTVLGLIPMFASQFWNAMAVAIACGLTGATLLTLVVLPVMYAIVFKVKAE